MTNRQVTVVHVKSKLAQAKLVRQLQPLKAAAEAPGYPPPTKMSPLALARHRLGARLGEDENGFRLDGRRVNLACVMRETNRLLHEQGVPQLTTNPAWVYVPAPR